jgi:hypothetical protein
VKKNGVAFLPGELYISGGVSQLQPPYNEKFV